YAQARLNKAVVYLDCGDYKRAQVELSRVLEIDPTDVDAEVALGVAARGLGRLEDARRAYERALELAPLHAAALYDLGVLYMDFKQDPARAREDLLKYRQVASDEDARQ